MHQTRTDTAKRPSASGLGKWLGAVVEGLNAVIEALGPQPQPQPVPVRVRAGRTTRRV